MKYGKSRTTTQRNPRRMRTQNYTPSGGKVKGYKSSYMKTGNKASTKYSANTPKVTSLSTGDSTATYGYIYSNN